MATVILTGATGFLGSNIAKALITDGHRVIALKRSSSVLHRLNEVKSELIFYDIENLDYVHPFTEHGHVDAVIHTATCYGRHGDKPSHIFQANTIFPLHLLEASLFFKTASFLNTDTYFNIDTILSSYLNIYALSKKHFAELGRLIAFDDRIRFINIRLEHLYGPGDNLSKFTTWIANSCHNNIPNIKLTAGKQSRDFIYIADAVSAYTQILLSLSDLKSGFLEFELGRGEGVTVRNFVEAVHRLTGSISNLSFGTLPYRDNELMESKANIEPLLALGWQCKIGLEEGISNMVKDLRK